MARPARPTQNLGERRAAEGRRSRVGQGRRPMEVRFRNVADGSACAWAALRPPRTRVPGWTMAAGGDLPHDLATFVIERALGVEHGFWGCVADAATFRSLGRRRTEPGLAVIRRHRDDLDDAERRVNEVHGAWKRGDAGAIGAQLDEMLARWRALPTAASSSSTGRVAPGGCVGLYLTGHRHADTVRSSWCP